MARSGSGDGQAGRSWLRALNGAVYRLAHHVAARRGPTWRRCAAALDPAQPGGADAAAADRPAARRSPAAPLPAGAPLILAQNGRLGDALLASAWTARYREWFGGPILAVGRPETAPITAPLVDAFVPFDPRADASAPAGLRSVARALDAFVGRGPVRAVVGDLHVFHGGHALLALCDALCRAREVHHHLHYAGWIAPALQAPARRWPRGVEVVPAVTKPARAVDADALHVLRDLDHYHRELLQRLGSHSAEPLPSAPTLPVTALDRESVARFQLPRDYVACHASSSQPKKDWRGFDALFAAFPDQRFALLGSGRDGPATAHAHVVDLRGRTSVPEALAVAADARVFVGVDSGLAHAAALAGVPTVVAMPAATPGYFFPYPQTTAGVAVTAVWSDAHRECAGCGGLCDRELLLRSRSRGLPCLRALPLAAVGGALQRALSGRGPAADAATPGATTGAPASAR